MDRCAPAKKIAVFTASLRGGGAERSMLNVAKGLAERNYAVDLVLARKLGPLLADVPSMVRLVDLRAKRVARSIIPLARYLRREKPAAVLSAMNHINIAALWARRIAGTKTRLVISERNLFTEWSRNSAKRIDRLIMPRLVKRFYPWADSIVTVSNGVADDLARNTGIPKERILTIYNPAANTNLTTLAKSPPDHRWFRAESPPVVVAAGRLHKQKDFATLIRAVKRVRETTPIRLLILGEGPERTALQELVRRKSLESDVEFPGFVRNPYAFMARAAVFVLSSRYEGLPGVLIEAMCCGTQVVATDCPSGPREILEDGQHGQLVPVGDDIAMAAAIRQALDTKRVPTRESLRRFDPDAVVDQYLGVLFGHN